MVILVPVDDGPLRERVLDTAIALGRGLDQELYVVHLTTDESADGEAKRVRDEISEKLSEAGVPATVALEYVSHIAGRPGTRIGQEVIELASDVDISHIVMGHTTQGVLRELARGSAAFSVAKHATVPVTIVPENSLDE